MKSFKKTLRLIGLVLLLVLATVGMGITGGIPPRNTGKRDEMIEINVKIEEETEASADMEKKDIKS